jgi:hypothetical protein
MACVSSAFSPSLWQIEEREKRKAICGFELWELHDIACVREREEGHET